MALTKYKLFNVATLAVLYFALSASVQASESASLRTNYAAGEDESIFDDVRIHGGVSLLNSFQDFAVAPGVREKGGIGGFELSFGADLFSPHWIAEGDLLTFPETQVGNARLSTNAFELRLLYDTTVAEAVTLHFGAGISSRSYDIKSNSFPENSFSSGASVLVSGIDYWPNGDISCGLELTDHLPLASGDDPSSIDLGIRLSGHF